MAFAATLYMVALITRAIFDWIRVFARQWRPRGIALVTANIAYSLTDGPIRAVRRVVPPLNLGGISLDLGFLIIFFAVLLLRMGILIAARMI